MSTKLSVRHKVRESPSFLENIFTIVKHHDEIFSTGVTGRTLWDATFEELALEKYPKTI